MTLYTELRSAFDHGIMRNGQVNIGNRSRCHEAVASPSQRSPEGAVTVRLSGRGDAVSDPYLVVHHSQRTTRAASIQNQGHVLRLGTHADSNLMAS